MKRALAFPILIGAGIGVVVGLLVGSLPVWLALGAGAGMTVGFGRARQGVK
jgi:hypothetical protein